MQTVKLNNKNHVSNTNMIRRENDQLDMPPTRFGLEMRQSRQYTWCGKIQIKCEAGDHNSNLPDENVTRKESNNCAKLQNAQKEEG
jgi:hypothetical protein